MIEDCAQYELTGLFASDAVCLRPQRCSGARPRTTTNAFSLGYVPLESHKGRGAPKLTTRRSSCWFRRAPAQFGSTTLALKFQWTTGKPAAHHHYIMPCMPNNAPAQNNVRTGVRPSFFF